MVLKISWEEVKKVMIKQRERQKKYANEKRREVCFSDQAMLRTENLAKCKGKLQDVYVGPFTVQEVYDNGVNVKLNLPNCYRSIHPVFHVEKLKRFTPSKLEWPGRRQKDRPKPELVRVS